MRSSNRTRFAVLQESFHLKEMDLNLEKLYAFPQQVFEDFYYVFRYSFSFRIGFQKMIACPYKLDGGD